MSEITVSIDDVVAREIAKRDKKIEALQKRLATSEAEVFTLKRKLSAIEVLRDAIVGAAYAVDNYYGDDD